MQIDHRDDYKIWDDTESGRVILTRGTSTNEYDIEVMLRGPFNRRLNGDPVLYDAQTVGWSIPDALLNPNADEGRIIQRDDVIVGEDGSRWTVIQSELAVVNSHWYCGAVQEQ